MDVENTVLSDSVECQKLPQRPVGIVIGRYREKTVWNEDGIFMVA